MQYFCLGFLFLNFPIIIQFLQDAQWNVGQSNLGLCHVYKAHIYVYLCILNCRKTKDDRTFGRPAHYMINVCVNYIMNNAFKIVSRIMNLTILAFYIRLGSQPNMTQNSAEYFPQLVNNAITTANPTCTMGFVRLTHWGRVTHICISKLTIIGSDRGLLPGWHQAIIWSSAGILLIGPWGTNVNEVLIKTQTFSFKKMH